MSLFMPLRSLKSILPADSPPTGADLILGALGVSGAVLAASFAGYMLSVGPGDVRARSQGEFTVFVPWDRRLQISAGRSAPRSLDSTTPTPGPEDVAGVDFTPTGSVGATDSEPESDTGLLPNTDTSASPSKPTAVLQDFTVRDVFDGKALVEARNTLQLVKPGTILDGAGEVLSIERQGNAWVVLTSDGIINQRR
jgi:hypothetical protein